jgi:hypothetical protein
MRKTALAKTVDPAPREASEAAQLRAQIVDIISNEYIGDIHSELWLQPARRAADKIMEAIGGATARLSGEGYPTGARGALDSRLSVPVALRCAGEAVPVVFLAGSRFQP